MPRQNFDKIIFKVAHLISTHVNQDEYIESLNLVYNRITRVRKFYPNGEEKIFRPSIKITLLNNMSKEEYDTLTWENFENADNIHLQLYEQYEAEPAEEEKNDENKDKVINEIPASARNNNTDRTYERKGTKARPKLKIISDFKSDKEKSDVNLKDSYYKVDKNFYMYNEEVFFLDQKEIDSASEELNTHIKYELMDDDELVGVVISSLPLRFVLTSDVNDVWFVHFFAPFCFLFSCSCEP